MLEQKQSVPLFNLESITQKVQIAEHAWNTKNPEKASLVYKIDTEWLNRDQFINGREEVKTSLKANGKKSWSTNKKKTYGYLRTIELL